MGNRTPDDKRPNTVNREDFYIRKVKERPPRKEDLPDTPTRPVQPRNPKDRRS